MERAAAMKAEEDQEWLDYRARFAQVYDAANYTAHPLQSWVMHASHRLTEKKFGNADHFANVLEVGAGTGEHFPYVRHGFHRYVMTDADPQALDVARAKIKNDKVSFDVQAGENLGYPDSHFNRVVAVHVLEHIYQPHLVLKEWRRVVADGGVLSILIPGDPGIAWRLGRHLGPRRQALAQGIPYDYVMAREHVNACNTLIALIRHYFPERTESWWPCGFPSIDMNLFFACHAVIRK